MKVLLLGSGGREHALGWAISRSPRCDELMSLSGNPGLAELGPSVEGIDASDVGAVAAFARAQGTDLVVVGPEAPLAAGVVDALNSMGVAAFGPTRAGARLEASKSFAKEVMAAAGVPTGAYGQFTDAAEAAAYLTSHPAPHVVKADGLAAGKGVLVTESLDDATAWVERCLTGSFASGEEPTVVIEEFLPGPELSVFFLCDGINAVPLQPARDYKRRSEGDTGPNTGGMGSFSPVADLPEGLVEEVRTTIALPVLTEMASRGTPYRGFLYVGLALTPDGPKVIEFNCRLGDPETQAVLPLLESDLLALMHAAATATLPDGDLVWSDRAAVNVVLAADGYPESPTKGGVITGIPTPSDDLIVFHAGTTSDEKGRTVANGGRVLSVVGLGDDVPSARQRAYGAVDAISWPHKVFRTDIAQ
ncbi:MAG: phosphoribosylamine--glycine ligase [Acidimicrobiia bacterium]|nr:phosphoribosylamine--glycine ligase [Acidimicrobiia bacterium]